MLDFYSDGLVMDRALSKKCTNKHPPKKILDVGLLHNVAVSVQSKQVRTTIWLGGAQYIPNLAHSDSPMKAEVANASFQIKKSHQSCEDGYTPGKRSCMTKTYIETGAMIREMSQETLILC